MELKIGSRLKRTRWDGKVEYFKVVDFTWSPVCRFIEGGTAMICDAANHDEVPLAKYTFKSGKEMKYPAVQLSPLEDFEVLI
jgi:hypothetical protein